jgi:hypothetical protein
MENISKVDFLWRLSGQPWDVSHLINTVLWHELNPYLSGLIPLVSLIYLNFRVWSVLRRRRRLQQRLINTTSTALKAEAARQAQVGNGNKSQI